MFPIAAPRRGAMNRHGGALRCEVCGAVWKSPMAHQIALRDGGCLRCGGGPLVEVAGDDDPPKAGDDPGDDD